MHTFIQKIKSYQFAEAADIIHNQEDKELLYKALLSEAVLSEDIVFYTFFILIQKSYENDAVYCYYLATLLSTAYNTLEGAYALARFYCRKAIALAPQNSEYAQYLAYIEKQL